jgi:predicted permease
VSRTPPRWAEWLAGAALPEEERAGVLGDLAEEYAARRDTGRSDWLWYLRVAVGLALRFTSERLRERWTGRGTDASINGLKGRGEMGDWVRDLHTSARALVRRPGFTAVAVATLALGIGATTAIFSVLSRAVLRPLPYPEADELVFISDTRIGGWSGNSQSVPNALDIQAQSSQLENLAVYQHASANLSYGDATERVRGMRTTPSFFPVLGLPPQLGRSFTEEENLPGAAPVVVLGHALWQSRFGGDRDILGRTVTLDAEPFTVIGVAHPDVDLWSDPQLFLPMRWDPESLSRGTRGVNSIGRIRDGGSLDALNAEVDGIMTRLRDAYPEPNDGWTAAAIPLEQSLVGSAARRQLWLLIGAAGLVLLIACVNVANLLLARAEIRSREIAVRAALGAGRSRLVGLFLSESLLLAGCGGLLGFLGAFAGVPLLARAFGSGLPGAESAELSPVVLGVALLITVLSGLLVGTIPAARIQLHRLGEGLREGGRGATRGATSLRRGLVVVQISLAVTLVVGAGLLLRSYWAVSAIDVGLEAPEQVVTFQVQLPSAVYPNADAIRDFTLPLTQRLASLPGVESVGVTNRHPLNGGTNVTEVHAVDNPDQTAGFVELRTVTEGFFEATGMTLLRGRGIEPADHTSEVPVTVVTEELARQLWPEEDPLGKSVAVWEGFEPQVIGVVSDTRDMGPTRAPPPGVYFPVGGNFQPSNLILVARTQGNPLDLLGMMREEVSQADPNLAVYDVRLLSDIVSQAAGRRRQTSMSLILVFGAIAIVLGAVGIYGVMSYQVTQRSREMGVRIALGAKSGEVSWMVLRQGIRLTALGIVIGVVASYFSTRLLESMLFEVEAGDRLTNVAVALLLALVAVGASWVPARRASRVDPIQSFRME